MSDHVVVIGSGASGVSFACCALEQGFRVTMVDVGLPRPEVPVPQSNFSELNRDLDDSRSYFLGEDFQSLILPGEENEYYGFPPAKGYVFEGVEGFEHEARGFSPLFSFAAGGLAEAWTGGCYPFNDGELEDFPFDYQDIEPHYAAVARRIGITGVGDDLAPFMPLHDGLMSPLDLDAHSECLLERYGEKRSTLAARGVHLGRSRIATLSQDHGGRKACSYLGRCLWGCPTDSLYTPSVTLGELRGHDRFEYVPRVLVTHFSTTSEGRVGGVHGRRLDGGDFETGLDRLVLAAGTLATSRIFLESVRKGGGGDIELGGLMDNRQVLMPFLNRSLVGHPWKADSYQYNQLAIGLEGATPMDYVHGLVTTLKTAMIHPVVPNLPVDMKLAQRIFRNIHGALGLVNINFPDTRRDSNRVTLEGSGESTRLLIRHTPPDGEEARIRDTCRTFRWALKSLGCVVPRSMSRVRPMGSSVHYSGTIPMSRDSAPWTTSPTCRSHDFENLWLVDGATFPVLPAKNLTFTLMANAQRVVALDF